MKDQSISKANYFAKKLTQNIENGTIQRKVLISEYGEKYSGPPSDELALFWYKRYIGSLRCMIDMKTMKEYNGGLIL